MYFRAFRANVPQKYPSPRPKRRTPDSGCKKSSSNHINAFWGKSCEISPLCGLHRKISIRLFHLNRVWVWRLSESFCTPFYCLSVCCLQTLWTRLRFLPFRIRWGEVPCKTLLIMVVLLSLFYLLKIYLSLSSLSLERKIRGLNMQFWKNFIKPFLSFTKPFTY